MKKILAVMSMSLWAAALTFSPAPAQAAKGKYPSNVPYFSCSQYATITPVTCKDGEGYTVAVFYGKMTNTIPLSMCAGSCTGSEALLVENNPGPGRKSTYSADFCGAQYILDFSPCTTCS